MQTKCPACGAVCSLDVLIANDEASAAIAAALEFNPLGKQLIRYLALFRPKKNQLGFGRVATLLGELLPMIRAGQIERDGVTWPAPLPYWQSALDQLLVSSTLTLPLKSHGYLLSVIAGIGEKAAGQAEAAAEVVKRNRSPPAAPTGLPPPPPPEQSPPPGRQRLSDEDRNKGRAAVAALTNKLKLRTTP